MSKVKGEKLTLLDEIFIVVIGVGTWTENLNIRIMVRQKSLQQKQEEAAEVYLKDLDLLQDQLFSQQVISGQNNDFLDRPLVCRQNALLYISLVFTDRWI